MAKGETNDLIEILIVRCGGEKRTIVWSFADITGNDRESVIATIAHGQEITGRKAAEEQIQETGVYDKGARFEIKVPRGGWLMEPDQKASEGAKSPQ